MDEAATAAFTRKVLGAMYKQSAERLLARLEMVDPTQVEAVRRWPETRAGILAAVTPEPCLSGSLVVGGPCIDHCDADVARLRVNVIVDLVVPLVVASRLGATCCMYLFVPAGDRRPGWDEVTAALLRAARWVAERLGVSCSVIESSARVVADALADERARVRADIDDATLSGAYAVGSGARVPQLKTHRLLDDYESAVASYSPKLLSRVLGRPVERVVVAENVQQAIAVSLARRVEAGRGGEPTIAHLAHLTAPSLSGRSRMSRTRTGALLVGDTRAAYASAIDARACATSQRFWRTWCSSDVLGPLDAGDGLDVLVRIGKVL